MKGAYQISEEALKLCEGEDVQASITGLGTAMTVIAAQRGVSPGSLIEFFIEAVHDAQPEMGVLAVLAKKDLQ